MSLKITPLDYLPDQCFRVRVIIEHRGKTVTHGGNISGNIYEATQTACREAINDTVGKSYSDVLAKTEDHDCAIIQAAIDCGLSEDAVRQIITARNAYEVED